MQAPNILILMCDQMQARRMGFVDGIAYTPNLDKLASEGVHFRNAISVSGQCVPARCAFMTGQPPHECNVMVNYGFFEHGGHITAKNRTFVREFQEHGYTTAHFGKSHLGSPLTELGFTIGAEYDRSQTPGRRPVERVRISEEDAVKCGYAHASESSKVFHYQALHDGLAWLENYRKSDGPLLFIFDTNLPHPGFYWEPEFKERFRPDDMILPKSYFEETFKDKPAFQKKHAEDGHHGVDSEEQLRLEMAQYYTMISAVDKACGRIIDALKAKDMWDNTIVLFFADHGDMMGGHKTRLKGTLPYEELYNIPCILKLPAGMRSRRSVIDEVVSSTALPGALLELAGIGVPPVFAGGHVTRALRREAPSGDECAFFEHYAAYWGIHPFYGIRTATMKYVRYYGSDDTEEMYDLARDPDELNNVVNDPTHQQMRKNLSAKADNWWHATGGRSAEYYESDEFKANLNRQG